MSINIDRIVLDMPRQTASGELVFDEVFVKDILSGQTGQKKHMTIMFLSMLADIYTWLGIPPREQWKAMSDEAMRQTLRKMFDRYARLIELGYHSYFFHETIMSGEEPYALDE